MAFWVIIGMMTAMMVLLSLYMVNYAAAFKIGSPS
jgi:hypothetical protein